MIIYDVGPVRPVRPVKPQVLLDAAERPAGAEGHPAIEPELRRYTDRYRDYLRSVETYEAERANWERKSGGGAVEIFCSHSVDAGEMLERGGGRYVATLPKGV